MYPTSARFRQAVVTSHKMVSWVEIVGTGQTVRGWSAAVVKQEMNAAVRSTFAMTVTDETGLYLDRGQLDAPLSRFGSEVRPWRGVEFSDGTVEAVPLGTFRIETNDPTENGDGWELAITARDRSSIVNRKTPRPIAVALGTPLHTAVEKIIRAMYPAAICELSAGPWTVGTTLIETGANPWEVATALAAASGLVLFVDRLGVFRMVPGLADTDPVVWHFDEGDDCTFTAPPQVTRGTGQPIPNGFIVTGTSTGSSSSGIRGEAWDLDPRSPTYRYGRYGQNVEIVQSDKVRTNAQAVLAAETLLRRALGQAETIAYNAIVNPALDVYDIAWVTRTKLGLSAPFYIASIETPLDAGTPGAGTLGRHMVGGSTDTSLAFD